MTTRCITRRAGACVLLALASVCVGCSGSGSARSDYFASRSVTRGAQPGDGSVIVYDRRASDASWSAELSYAPVGAGGDLAAGD